MASESTTRESVRGRGGGTARIPLAGKRDRPTQGGRDDLPGSGLRVHPVAVAVFDALDRAGVRWCVLRGERQLQDPPHDVDLLVAPTDLNAMANAVRPLGFLPVPTWARGSHQFFVTYLASVDQWFVLDVVTELAYGPGYAIKTEAAAGCLSRRQQSESLALLSGDDAFWTLLLHCLLDRSDFPAHQKKRLRALAKAAQAETALACFASAACPYGWDAARIVTAIDDGDWDALSLLGPQMIARWRGLNRLRFVMRSLGHRLAWRVASVHALLALRGLRVALVSDDAECARSLGARLSESFYFPVKVLDAKPSANRSHSDAPLGAWAADARRLAGIVRLSIAARYNQGRGRLVAVRVAEHGAGTRERADSASSAVPAGLRPHLVLDLRGSDPAPTPPVWGASKGGAGRGNDHRVHRLDERGLAGTAREVVALIWSAYGRRWGRRLSRRAAGAPEARPL
jgi:hypothetical protein